MKNYLDGSLEYSSEVKRFSCICEALGLISGSAKRKMEDLSGTQKEMIQRLRCLPRLISDLTFGSWSKSSVALNTARSGLKLILPHLPHTKENPQPNTEPSSWEVRSHMVLNSTNPGLCDLSRPEEHCGPCGADGHGDQGPARDPAPSCGLLRGETQTFKPNLAGLVLN